MTKRERLRGILHSHDPDKPGSDPVLVDGIEVFDDDPDIDEVLEAADRVVQFGTDDDIEELRKALEPKQ